MDAMQIMTTVRDALTVVPGVKTLGIGMESNMAPDDYPMVRIVPENIRAGSSIHRTVVAAKIYFGQPVHEFTAGLEAEYSTLLAMADALLGVLLGMTTVGVQWHETVMDEDRIEAYKLFALRVTLTA